MLRTADEAVVVGDGLPELDGQSHVRRIAAQPVRVAASLRELAGAQEPAPRQPALRHPALR